MRLTRQLLISQLRAAQSLFVGTKKQAQDAIKTEAERCGMYYVNERWLGGMLTNFKTIQSRIAKIKSRSRRCLRTEHSTYFRRRKLSS